MALLGLVGAGVLVWQLGSGDVFRALARADPTWALIAAAASVVPFLGAAVSLSAFTPAPVPLGRAVAVQVASGFVSVVTPPTVGQLAVNARFLHQLGLSTPVVTSVVALNEMSSVVVTVALLLVAVLVTGTGVTVVSTTTVLVVLGVLVPTALVLITAPRLRRRTVTSVARRLAEVRPHLRSLGSQPHRVAVGLGGNLLLTAGYVAALEGCLRAFAIDLPLLQTAIVLLAGNAVGSAAPTPAGLGAVEAALTAGLVAAGLPAAAALSAVLLYRFITVWARVAPGWLAQTLLQRQEVL